MKLTFDPRAHLIGIYVRLTGPTGHYNARLALDTGASFTLIAKDILELIGYDPDSFPKTDRFTTGSGVETAARLDVEKVEAFDHQRPNFTVVAHNLPPTSMLDRVLGLDFLRDRILTINFQTGEIALD